MVMQAFEYEEKEKRFGDLEDFFVSTSNPELFKHPIVNPTGCKGVVRVRNEFRNPLVVHLLCGVGTLDSHVCPYDGDYALRGLMHGLLPIGHDHGMLELVVVRKQVHPSNTIATRETET